MVTGEEKCKDCKKSPFPRGWESTLEKCWYCALPHPIVVLNEAQKEFVNASMAR